MGQSCSTLEIKVNYVRPMTIRTGPVRYEAKIIHVGSGIAIGEGRLVDSQDKLYAPSVKYLFDFLSPEREIKCKL